MPETILDKFGFKDDFVILRCRLCDARIPKTGLCVLLGVTCVYGFCRKYTHGVTVRKAML